MWDPRAPAPPMGCRLRLVQEWGAFSPPRGWLGLRAARGGGSPRRRSCCNAPFSVPQSPALGVRVGKVSRPPQTRVNSHVSDRRRRGPSSLPRLRRDTRPGNTAVKPTAPPSSASGRPLGALAAVKLTAAVAPARLY